MKKNKGRFLSLGVLFIALVSMSVIAFQNNWQFKHFFPFLRDDSNPNQNTDGDNIDDDSNLHVDSALTCFDFIDLSFQQDGFTYLGGSQWGRGRGVESGIPWSINFIIDLDDLTFAFNIDNHSIRPVDWYLDYENNTDWVYFHDIKQVKNLRSIESIGEFDFNVKDLNEFNDTLLAIENNVMFYSMKTWMDYYVDVFAHFDCPIEDFTQETRLNYANQLSRATQMQVVSVFDRTSTDGIIRYFADVYEKGRVQDHLRYKEIKSFDELNMLDKSLETINKYIDTDIINLNNWEQFYHIILTYHNYEGRTFSSDLSFIDGRVLEHFVKDVMYRFTVDGEQHPRTPTIGIYFINIDNPNQQFSYLYESRNNDFSGYGNFMKTKTPYETTFLFMNVNQVNERVSYARTPAFLYETLRWMIVDLEHDVFELEVEFADEFIMHYTRPFSLKWQQWMGLTDLFKEKFNLTIDDIVRR